VSSFVDRNSAEVWPAVARFNNELSGLDPVTQDVLKRRRHGPGGFSCPDNVDAAHLAQVEDSLCNRELVAIQLNETPDSCLRIHSL
jgi:hypothetical protein